MKKPFTRFSLTKFKIIIKKLFLVWDGKLIIETKKFKISYTHTWKIRAISIPDRSVPKRLAALPYCMAKYETLKPILYWSNCKNQNKEDISISNKLKLRKQIRIGVAWRRWF